MTEQDWRTSQDPQAMLEFLRMNGFMSNRKARLFSTAVGRRSWPLLHDEILRQAIEMAERFADGDVGDNQLAYAAAEALASMRRLRDIWPATGHSVAESQGTKTKEMSRIYRAGTVARFAAGKNPHVGADIAASSPEVSAIEVVRELRELFGNPFRPVNLDPAWLTWNSGAIPRAALAAYEERALPSGHLDNERLAVLADMLEEAGCRDEEVVGHLRRPDAVHVRGCWCVDLLLAGENKS